MNSALLPVALLPAAALLAIIAALALARVAARRDRVARRERIERLRDELLAFVARNRRADETLDCANAAAPEELWSALDRVPRRLRAGRLAHLMAHSDAAVDERFALRDDGPGRAEHAALRLSLVRSHATRHALRRQLVRGPEPVAYACARSLARLRDGGALTWLLTHPDRFARRTARARAELYRLFGRAGEPRLREALMTAPGDAAHQRAILDALRQTPDRAGQAAIELRLRGVEVELRIAAARTFGRIRAVGAADALIAALRDSSWEVRAQSARSLGRLQCAAAAEALTAALPDAAAWVRRNAAMALAALGEVGERRLREAAATGSAAVRTEAERALASCAPSPQRDADRRSD